MIVERSFHYPKTEFRDDLVDLLKAEFQRYPGPRATRIYWDLAGSSSPVATEIEFENFVEYTKWWGPYHEANPEVDAFWEKYAKLVDRQRTNELWFQAE